MSKQQTYGIMYLDNNIGGYLLRFTKAKSIEQAKGKYKKYAVVQAYKAEF